MKIVIPDYLDLIPEDLEKLKGYENISVHRDVVNEPEEIIKRIEGAELITANYIDLTREIIERSPSLKYIISPAVGYDWIDVKTASEHGIKVINCPTFNTHAVAEHAIGLIFAVYRQTFQAQEHIKSGEWEPKQFLGHEVSGKTLLTIGYGNIGRQISTMALGLGMNVNNANSQTNETELEELIKAADIVVLCYPLNEKTKGSFNAHKISLLKKEAILINVARGLVLDQEALFQALLEKRFLGAGLDVFNKDEMLTTGREDIIKFAELPNVIATPHIAFRTIETNQRFGKEFFANIDAILAGNPINVVN